MLHSPFAKGLNYRSYNKLTKPEKKNEEIIFHTSTRVVYIIDSIPSTKIEIQFEGNYRRRRHYERISKSVYNNGVYETPGNETITGSRL